MKEYKPVVLVILFALLSEGMKAQRQEIGLGTGYIEYNVAQNSSLFYDQYGNRWTQTLKKDSSWKFNYLKPAKDVLSNLRAFSLPVLYYTLQFPDGFNLRFSYQFSQVKNKKPLPYFIPYQTGWNEFDFYIPIQSNYQYQINFNEYNVGFAFVLNPKQKVAIYAGADFTALLIRHKAYFEMDLAEVTVPPRVAMKDDYRDYSLGSRQFLGIDIPFNPNVHFKYECAGYFSDDVTYYLRPLNRFSLNYRFD